MLNDPGWVGLSAFCNGPLEENEEWDGKKLELIRLGNWKRRLKRGRVDSCEWVEMWEMEERNKRRYCITGMREIQYQYYLGCTEIFQNLLIAGKNVTRQIRIIEHYRKWIHPGWCLQSLISINSNTLLEKVVKWPTCGSNLNTNILLSHLVACPHCVYSLCQLYFFSAVLSSIRLFFVWPTGEKAAESVGAICLQQTGFWHLLRTATINTVRAYVMNTHTRLQSFNRLTWLRLTAVSKILLIQSCHLLESTDWSGWRHRRNPTDEATAAVGSSSGGPRTHYCSPVYP